MHWHHCLCSCGDGWCGGRGSLKPLPSSFPSCKGRSQKVRLLCGLKLLCIVLDIYFPMPFYRVIMNDLFWYIYSHISLCRSMCAHHHMYGLFHVGLYHHLVLSRRNIHLGRSSQCCLSFAQFLLPSRADHRRRTTLDWFYMAEAIKLHQGHVQEQRYIPSSWGSYVGGSWGYATNVLVQIPKSIP